MTKIFNINGGMSNKKLNSFLFKNRLREKNISDKVSEIILNVKNKGDKALVKYTKKYDNYNINNNLLKVSESEINYAIKDCSSDLKKALKIAAKRIGDFHKLQTPEDFKHRDKEGVYLGVKWTPLDSVGLYVPGGKASYPSSVLMTAVPAKIAGVNEISMCVPSPKGYLNSSVLLAAKIAGVNNIYKIGGAQAIAALAFGTETITPVNKIFGPGNSWVAEAKRQVFGKVGIDMLAGPSEIMVLADKKNNPKWIAADLLSQAEHDFAAQSILITNDLNFAKKVEIEIKKLFKILPRSEISQVSWKENGLIIVVKDWKKAIEIINFVAPEHLELAIDKPESISKNVKNAGAIFMGRYVPEAIGDYIAGPNHVLPTSGTAKFSSGLSTVDFMKRTSLVKCNKKSLSSIAPSAIRISKSEGLFAHALSMQIRTKKFKNEK